MAVLTALLLQTGGDIATEDPLLRVLKYLSRHQNENGSWGEPPPGCTCPTSCPLNLRLPIVPDDETVRAFEFLREDLTSDLPAERERTEKSIARLGLPVVPLLQDTWGHPDPEFRWRSRQTLVTLWSRNPEVRSTFRAAGCPGTDDLDLKATSLALLVYFGAGYSQLSKDQYPDPVAPHRTVLTGEVVKKALRWLVERQLVDGSFGASRPEGNFPPALALAEAYGMTAAPALKEYAVLAVEYVGRLHPTDPQARLWKEFVLESARLGELPVPERSPEALIRLFEAGTSTTCISGTVLASSFAKRPADAARARLLGLSPDTWTPEERFFGMLAVGRVNKIQSPERSAWRKLHASEWRKLNIDAIQCDRGTWPEETGRFEPRLLTTLYTALAYEQYYGYANALFTTP